MWILEFVLLSLVGGTILGVSWRMVDEYLDKRKRSNKSE